MPGNPTDKPSNEPPPDASPAGYIDDILSQAASLADELAEQVGVSDDHTTLSPDDAAFLRGGCPDGDAIDAQLAQVEQRLAETRSEVAEPPKTKEPEAAPMDYKAAAAALSDARADSSEPEVAESAADSPQAPPDKPAAKRPASSEAKPPDAKVVRLRRRESDASAGAAGAAEIAASAGRAFSAESLADAEDLSTFDDDAEASPFPLQPDEGAPLPPFTRGEGLVTNVVGALCTALEVIDAPFQRVGDLPRRVMGWLGLALLFAAFLVFVLSFFR